jgi:hypothetical protein
MLMCENTLTLDVTSSLCVLAAPTLRLELNVLCLQLLQIDRPLPSLQKLRIESDEPIETKFIMEREPILANPRRLIEEPIEQKSKILHLLPMVLLSLTLKVDFICTAPSTLSWKLILTSDWKSPRTEMDEPNRLKERTDRHDPAYEKLSTLKPKPSEPPPMRTLLRQLTEEPHVSMFNVLKALPKRT